MLTLRNQLQALLVAVSLGLAAEALRVVPEAGMIPTPRQWWLLLGSFGCALLGLLRAPLPQSSELLHPLPSSRVRFWSGIALAVAGAALCLVATRNFYFDWAREFDRTWVSWLLGTGLLGVGLDRAAGVWPAPQREGRRRMWIAVGLALLLGGAVRLGMIHVFPGPGGATQIEDVQFGNWGAQFLAGERSRWEFIGHAWVSAVSIAIGGPQMLSMRVGYAIVGTLAVATVFFWLRFAAGNLAALAGTAFLVVSSWDAVVARIGFNPNVLTVGALFVLLLGPARRGRPSAYALMGLLSGYLLWEYIAYRPAAFFALLGGAYYSLRDRQAGWALRWGRPLLMVALIAMVATPLFGNRLRDRFMDEYLNPINRARATRHYYNEDYDWRTVLDMRVQRTVQTIGLLFFQGDSSPTRNLRYRPLVDPVSSTLMLVGFAFCLANPLRRLFGMFAVAFVVTTIGAMIITGELNTLRFSVTIPYLYFFAGLAAAGVYHVWGRAWGIVGRSAAVSLLVAGLGFASYSNLTFLHNYWTSDFARRAARYPLAFVADWFRRNVGPDEQVIGAATGRGNEALGDSDGAWLRGRRIPGVLELDIMSALEGWKTSGPTVLVVFAGVDTRDTMKFLEYAIPGLEMEFIADELQAGSDVAFAHLPDRPARLDSIVAEMRCRGVRVEYRYIGEAADEVLHTLERVEPLIGLGTFAGEAVRIYHRGVHPRRLEIHYSATIRIDNPGLYRFEPNFYFGPVTIDIDGQRILPPDGGVRLSAGEHEFRAVADLAPLGGGWSARMMWRGPDTGGETELVPFYRIADPLPPCPPAAPRQEEEGGEQPPALSN